MDDSLSELKTKIAETIIVRSNFDQRVIDNTFTVLGGIKESLHELSAELDELLEDRLDDRIKIEYRDRGRFEAQMHVGEDIVLFSMHSNVFQFGTDDAVWSNPTLAADRSKGYCGVINIYNFLADSFRYNRQDDEGYLIGRLFVNHDNNFSVDGRLGEILSDMRFCDKVITREDIGLVVYAALNYSIKFDMWVPPYDKVKVVTVDQFNTKLENPKIVSGKRLGHDF